MVVRRSKVSRRRVAPTFIPSPRSQATTTILPSTVSEAQLKYERKKAAFDLALKVAKKDDAFAIFSLSPKFGGSKEAQEFYRQIIATPGFAARQEAKFAELGPGPKYRLEQKEAEKLAPVQEPSKTIPTKEVKVKTSFLERVARAAIVGKPTRRTARVEVQEAQQIAPIRSIDVEGPTTTKITTTPTGTTTTMTKTGGAITATGFGIFDVPVENIVNAAATGGTVELPAKTAPQTENTFKASARDILTFVKGEGIAGGGIFGRIRSGKVISEQAAIGAAKLMIGTGEFAASIIKTGFGGQFTKEELQTFYLTIGRGVDFGAVSPKIKAIKEEPTTVTGLGVQIGAIGLGVGAGVGGFIQTARAFGTKAAIWQTLQTFSPFGLAPRTYIYPAGQPRDFALKVSGRQFQRFGQVKETAFTSLLDDAGQQVTTTVYQRGIFSPRGIAQSVRLQTVTGAPFVSVRGGIITQGTASAIKIQKVELLGTGVLYLGISGASGKNPLAITAGEKVGVSRISEKQLLFLQADKFITPFRIEREFLAGTAANRLLQNPSQFFTGEFKKGTLTLTQKGREFKIGQPLTTKKIIDIISTTRPTGIGKRGQTALPSLTFKQTPGLVQQPTVTSEGTLARSLIGTSLIQIPETTIGLTFIPQLTRTTTRDDTRQLTQAGITPLKFGDLTTTTTIPAQAQSPITKVTPVSAVTTIPTVTQTTATVTTTSPTITPFVPFGPRGFETILGAPVAPMGLGFFETPGRKKKIKRKFRRQPSFAALVLDISSPEPRRGEFTGLIERPVIK